MCDFYFAPSIDMIYEYAKRPSPMSQVPLARKYLPIGTSEREGMASMTDGEMNVLAPK